MFEKEKKKEKRKKERKKERMKKKKRIMFTNGLNICLSVRARVEMSIEWKHLDFLWQKHVPDAAARRKVMLIVF